MALFFNDFDGNDSVLGKRRKGTFDDPYIAINEDLQIVGNRVPLTEIPNKFNKVVVSGLEIDWVEITTGTPSVDQFLVDYSQGLVTFHTSRNLQTLNFSYLGEGIDNLPSSRIWTKRSGQNVTETLDQTVNSLDTFTLSLQNRVDNIVSNAGSSNTEIVDARLVNGTTYPTLKGRLDAERTSLEIKLADTAKKLTGKVNLTEYESYKVTISGGFDWKPAIQKAIDDIVASKKVTELTLPDGTYKIASGLTIDIAYIKLKADGAILDASSITSGSAVRIKSTGTATLGRVAVSSVLGGVTIVGDTNDKTKCPIGIEFRGDSANNTVSNYIFDGIRVFYCNEGVVFKDNSYCITVRNSYISRCGTCVRVYNGTNMGERIAFENTTLADSDLLVRMEEPDGSIRLINCSLDYPTFSGTSGSTGGYLKVTAGRVFVIGGHIEGNDETATNVPDYGVYVAGDAARVVISNCEFLPRNRITKPFFFVAGTSDVGHTSVGIRGGGLTVRDCHMYLSTYDYKTMVDGSGRVVWENVSRYNSNIRNPISEQLNMIYNADFSNSTIGLGEWTIVTSDCPPTLDTISFLTGGRSVRLDKSASVGGSTCTFEKTIPVKPSNIVLCSAVVKGENLSESGKNLTLGIYYYNDTGFLLDSHYVTISTTDWVRRHFGGFAAPKGATKATIRFTTGSWSGTANDSNKAWVDSVLVNIT